MTEIKLHAEDLPETALDPKPEQNNAPVEAFKTIKLADKQDSSTAKPNS